MTRNNLSYAKKKWIKHNSKNYRLGRVKSACSGFGRIVTYRKPAGVTGNGPTHFGCGPGFKK